MPDVTTPDVQDPALCRWPGWNASGAGKLSRVAGDFDSDGARDQLLAYAELDAGGQPSQWHIRIVLARGVADLSVGNTSDWIGPNGLVDPPSGRRQP